MIDMRYMPYNLQVQTYENVSLFPYKTKNLYCIAVLYDIVSQCPSGTMILGQSWPNG